MYGYIEYDWLGNLIYEYRNSCREEALRAFYKECKGADYDEGTMFRRNDGRNKN